MTVSSVSYLKSLPAVRQRAQAIYALAQQGKTEHFALDESKISDVAQMVASLIKRDHGSLDKVPTHGRWRSYCIKTSDGVTLDLISKHVDMWQSSGVDTKECARRVIDLFVISVLIDAGAGSHWSFMDPEFGKLTRTEGLGMAALRMFENGVFSSNKDNKFQADSQALSELTDQMLLDGFQVSTENPLLGGPNRAQLLRNLGGALVKEKERFFGGLSGVSEQPGRPGFMLDYLESCAASKGTLEVSDLWKVIVDGFETVWPASRTQLDGQSLGDVWPCPTLSKSLGSSEPRESLVPFHKLSQWLTWSLLEVLVRLGGFNAQGVELLTGLPEYRNGGVLVDLGVLTLNPEDYTRGLKHPDARNVPLFDGSDPVIVEWRALTVALLDKVAEMVKDIFESSPDMLLGRVLEGGTWKAGREIAAKLRKETADPPINIVSDGTLF